MTDHSTRLDALIGADWPEVVANRRAEITARLNGRRQALLFGSGYLGRHVVHELPSMAIDPIGFVDNNPATWGTEVEGLPVLSPTDAAARYGGDVLWLITVYTNAPVISQLASLGVPWMTCAELSWVMPQPTAYSFDFGAPELLASDGERIADAAEIWADEDSREEYLTQVRWRFLLDYATLRPHRDPAELYFADDLITRRKDETFVDCGAFTGDSVEAFMTAWDGGFREIVAVEPDVVSRDTLAERVDAWADAGIGPISIAPVAAGSAPGTIRFSTTGTAGSSVGAGEDSVRVDTLDHVLAGKAPTFIKYDVEGAEHEALLGTAESIRRSKPILAVCLYHRPHDLWDLPLLVRSLEPGYRFYVRRYSDERWETVLYAIPPDRLPMHD